MSETDERSDGPLINTFPGYDRVRDDYVSLYLGGKDVFFDPLSGRRVAEIRPLRAGAIGGPWVTASFPYRSEAGMPLTADIPVNNNEKLEWVRTLLWEIEKNEANIGADPTLGRRVNEMHAVIGQMMQDPGLNIVGKRLHDEFLNRVMLHNTFLKFAGDADSGEKVQTALKEISGSQLNLLFKVPEFVHALNFYEQNGQDFADLTPTADTITKANEEFRDQARAALAAAAAAGVLNADNVEWARNLAERFWRMSGRREKQAKTTINRVGESVFADDFSKGDFVLQKILRFKEWAESNREKKNLRAHMELMNGVDLGGKDYIEYLLEHADVYKKETAVGGVPGVDLALARMANGRLNFTAVNWANFDFEKAFKGGNPMDFWAFRHIKKPDDVREAMVGKKESYLRSPSDKALAALAEPLSYLKQDQYQEVAKLISNFAVFMQSSEASQEGLIRMNEGSADNMIGRLGVEFKLTADELNEVGKRVFGDYPWVGVELFLSKINAQSVLWTMIWEIFASALRQK